MKIPIQFTVFISLLLITGFHLAKPGAKKLAVSQTVSDAKAKLILDRTTTTYKLIKTFKANFSYTLFSPQDKVNQTQLGILWVKPSSNQYKIDFNNSELLCDGDNIYTYLRKQKEIQISKNDTSSQNINPAKIFTLYEKGYTYRFVENRVEKGMRLAIIDLFPQAVKKIFKAEISIHEKTHLIYRIKTFDKNGDQLIYIIKDYSLHPELPETFFKFNKNNFPGVEVVDLR